MARHPLTDTHRWFNPLAEQEVCHRRRQWPASSAERLRVLPALPLVITVNLRLPALLRTVKTVSAFSAADVTEQQEAQTESIEEAEFGLP